MAKGMYALSRFKKSLTIKTRLLIYNSLIMSHIRYGITLWGKTKHQLYNKLIKLNKKALRLIEIGKFHTEPIQKKHKLLKPGDIYKQEMYYQAYQFYNNRLHTAIDSNVPRRNIAIELRHESPILIPTVKNKDKQQYDYQLLKHIDTLPTSYKALTRVKTLKPRIKKTLINNYKDDVTCNLPMCYECIV